MNDTSKSNFDISVIIPVYNSSGTLTELVGRLKRILTDIAGDRYEIIMVNDGSSDASWEIIKEIAGANKRIVAVNLTRNFGQHNALMCGFSKAQGKYIITMDDDLQNPPEEINKLIEEIQKGYDVVYGISNIKQHSKFRNFGSEIIQYAYRKTFNLKIKITSFRIIRKEIVQNLLSYEKSFTFIDGLIAWYTTSIGNIYVEHHPRHTGTSGYSLKKLMILSLNMMTNFSILPVQLASLIGVTFSVIGFSFGLYFLMRKILFDISVSGYASIIVSIMIFSGVQLLTVGILGEYIGRIHINVNKRPQYAIKDIKFSE